MSITTYGELKTAVASWLNRDDLVDKIPDFIKLAELTLNKVMRNRRMITNSDITVAAGTSYGLLPATLLEPLFLEDSTTEAYTLEQCTVEQWPTVRRRMTSQGTPKFYMITGDRFQLCPTPSAQVTLKLHYYGTITALSGDSDTNWLLTYNADIYLYTALLHAASFLKDDQRFQLWSMTVPAQVATAVQEEQKVDASSKNFGASLNSPSDTR